ncbi:unnamed protein product [Eruca vesicaria subsp. sativa]|uniref:F-box domain-containing protein n=1 Tax=Eruca vesicaria subsp. sativa TaxID=29727 RepID=A0ABC8LJ16_ERUVS|nr:unnamed protein product [Eruca vesicaria subsp. sativa]
MEQLVAHGGNSTTTLPVDIIIEILSLLPAKSIIRFQSVSKEWFSIIRSKDLADTFLTRSKTRPHLLVVLELFSPGKLHWFSVPEHKDNSNDKTSRAISRQDMTHSTDVYYYFFSSLPVNGFVCFTHTFYSTSLWNSITVCNPITRQTVKLPDIGNNIGNKGRKVYPLLGYDPEEDQYKVLCVMTYTISYGVDQGHNQPEHYVCTVSSSEKQEWRNIENTTVDNYPYVSQGICIDGAIYYGVGQSNIARFDVRFENMELIKAPKESNISRTCYSTLVNYNGRLGGVEFHNYKQEMTLWILEDFEKQEWSRKTFKYPCEWKRFRLESKGLIHTGELMVFRRSPYKTKPFCAYYYDFNKESARKVDQIGGVETEEPPETRLCYPGYVENIRFL